MAIKYRSLIGESFKGSWKTVKDIWGNPFWGVFLTLLVLLISAFISSFGVWKIIQATLGKQVTDGLVAVIASISGIAGLVWFWFTFTSLRLLKEARENLEGMNEYLLVSSNTVPKIRLICSDNDVNCRSFEAYKHWDSRNYRWTSYRTESKDYWLYLRLAIASDYEGTIYSCAAAIKKISKEKKEIFDGEIRLRFRPGIEPEEATRNIIRHRSEYVDVFVVDSENRIRREDSWVTETEWRLYDQIFSEKGEYQIEVVVWSNEVYEQITLLFHWTGDRFTSRWSQLSQ
jgi:hypothetical protein